MVHCFHFVLYNQSQRRLLLQSDCHSQLYWIKQACQYLMHCICKTMHCPLLKLEMPKASRWKEFRFKEWQAISIQVYASMHNGTNANWNCSAFHVIRMQKSSLWGASDTVIKKAKDSLKIILTKYDV